MKIFTMTPNTLFLKNIGPFKGEKFIDFNLLAPFFLIHWHTGSGKSTIVEAIVFSLYGKLSKNRPPESFIFYENNQYSKNAEIIFTFSIASEKYRIQRNIPFLSIIR